MKRFYTAVTTAAATDGWRVLLDGRGIKTAGGRQQLLPSPAMAQQLAAEWAAQGDEIDPAGFAARDLADYALDVIAADPAATVHSLLPYAETDTLCYRADESDALHARQLDLWEPLLQAAEARRAVKFTRVNSILHQPQPPLTLERLGAELATLDPFTLAALTTLTTLAASLVIGLAALEADAAAETLWDAANLEEDWQTELWGHDAEAAARRARRLAAFTAAMQFARAVRA